MKRANYHKALDNNSLKKNNVEKPKSQAPFRYTEQFVIYW